MLYALNWLSQISPCLVPRTTLLGTKGNMLCTLSHEETEAKGPQWLLQGKTQEGASQVLSPRLRLEDSPVLSSVMEALCEHSYCSQRMMKDIFRKIFIIKRNATQPWKCPLHGLQVSPTCPPFLGSSSVLSRKSHLLQGLSFLLLTCIVVVLWGKRKKQHI